MDFISIENESYQKIVGIITILVYALWYQRKSFLAEGTDSELKDLDELITLKEVII
jgi:hypothetical protein